VTFNKAIHLGTSWVSASSPFALDGTQQVANSGGSSALALPAFSTTYGNDVVYVALVTNGGPGLAPTGGGLTFTLRARDNDGTSNDNVELWSAIASSPLSGAVITVNTTSSAFVTGCIFAFSGTKSSSPFDSNAAIPAITSTGNYFIPPTFTTSNNGTVGNDILIALGRTGGTVTAAAGFTLITGANFLGVNYQLVSSPQSAVTWTWATGTQGGGSIADAIIQGP
jgi:hypothetical protein